MALVVRRYIVKSPMSDMCIAGHQKLEEEFLREVAQLRPGEKGVSLQDYAERQMAIIHAHNARVQELFLGFVRDAGIAPALSSQDLDRPSFENFFGWDITLSVHSKRLFMEVRSATEAKFPIRGTPSFLREIDEKQFFMLSGQEEM